MTFQKKPKKPIKEWRKGILDHHKKGKSKADRAEFPASVVREAIERSGGICEYCRQRPSTSTHHVVGRNRSGRGVLSNAYRVCGLCHLAIEGSEEKKQELITLYRNRYGDHFWFDEQDHDEYARRQAVEREAEYAQRQRIEALEPILEIVSVMTGRKHKTSEIRLLETLNDRQISILLHLLHDMVPIREPKSYAYGERFED